MSGTIMIAFVLLSQAGVALFSAPADTPALRLLTRANEVRHLTPEQAALAYPVRIKGVVTGDVPFPNFFVQDQSAGIHVEGRSSRRFSPVLGDLVEIEGVTGPGRFAPVIREQRLRRLGKGRLPKTRFYAFNELADGSQDSQWVKMRGIVRSVSIDRTSWRETTLAMNVAAEGGVFKARVPIDQERNFSSLIDAEVRIEGVCGSLFNAERQLVGLLLYVPRLHFIRVEATAKAAKELPIGALLRFSPHPGRGHRVRVRGVVAGRLPGSALFIQSGSRGLRVLTQQETDVQIGDIVEAVGFPAMGESAPVLEDGVYYTVGRARPPDPIEFDDTVPWEGYDGVLMTMEARLLGRRQRPEGLTLLLRQNRIGLLFEAILPPPQSAEPLSSMPLESEVRVRGVCLVRSGGLWRVPESFRLVLRSADDITVLRAPTWWNVRHVLWLLGVTAMILLGVLAWATVLGRRLREQMRVVRQKLHAGAVLEERERIARELHDTLEQELAGITMQLDLAVDSLERAPALAKQALEAARRMSRHSMAGARRSVWDLRCHLLESGDLASALTQLIQPLNGGSAAIDIGVSGSPRRLPRLVEMNLLRIGQEAAANAVKHAQARQITVELEFQTESVRLVVRDDGKGFSPADLASAPDGHFGLLDMRERAQSLGSHLQIDSEPGRGARISVEVRCGTGGLSHGQR
ncbi:MAG: histidine kinase [Acidobacteriota bacterium]